jgi:hypothetical protein
LNSFTQPTAQERFTRYLEKIFRFFCNFLFHIRKCECDCLLEMPYSFAISLPLSFDVVIPDNLFLRFVIMANACSNASRTSKSSVRKKPDGGIPNSQSQHQRNTHTLDLQFRLWVSCPHLHHKRTTMLPGKVILGKAGFLFPSKRYSRRNNPPEHRAAVRGLVQRKAFLISDRQQFSLIAFHRQRAVAHPQPCSRRQLLSVCSSLIHQFTHVFLLLFRFSNRRSKRT